MATIDFKQIAAAALSRANVLVPQWLPGGKYEGHEYKVLNPLRVDRKPGSFLINIITGLWGDFAAGAKGGDLISLYAYLHGLDQDVAAREVAAICGIDIPEDKPKLRQKPDLKVVKTPWKPILPAPADAGLPPVAHYARGKPQKVWTYYDANKAINGFVYRFETSDGGKETLPVCFCEHAETGNREWRWLSFPEPRPLYGLDRLAAHPDKPVLLVEGEKCADVAIELLPELVIVSWPGGGKAVSKADWLPLYGRNVFAWADCDAQHEKLSKEEKALGIDPLSKPLLEENEQPGMKAMLEIGALLVAADAKTKFRLVDIPQPGEKTSGWDIADAVAEGMDADALKAFIRNLRKPSAETPKSKSTQQPPAGRGWEDLLLEKKGELVACLANVFDILRNDDNWQGVLAYNEFAYQVVKLKPPPYDGGKIGEWDEQDDVQTAMWITRKYSFAPSSALTASAAEAIAKFNGFNPVQDYIKSQKHDGIERLDSWLSDYMGVPKTQYTMLVGRRFMIGMIARPMEPGVKFDYCLVLEGNQGLKKSSALRILGGDHYGDTDLDLQSKDSMSALRGKWVYEISELGSLARSESSRQKSFLSRQVDEFRPTYGRREIRCPRQGVFTGTCNEWEWNKDPTGGRRFWPIECKSEVDTEGLAQVRDQLIAEAYIAWQKGERYWPTTEEQREIFDPEQLKRTAADTYVDMLHNWVGEQYKDFSLADAAIECLKLDASKLTRDVQTRIGHALRQLGCTRIEKRTHVIRYWYKPPEKNGASSTSGNANGGGNASISF
ncbi:Predicted P-loop ATPase and inactivated derivatives [Nitrosospira sp. Nsp11]|uniref:VapE domain-containing protein n=1 Tax=Nitrosospira sp. Nsp11 TaxID=1855338 RepID=UPI00091B40DA|nr:VapE domain-containing protein [Nitrosospira sp. Nsp11]SHL10890.1 Predicted P-loop ATPase and inactivated derivatives [Nitrosospira sp. Nsp11]